MATVGRSRSLEHKHGFDGKFPRCAVVGAAALILFVERLIPGLAIAQSETPIALVPEHFSWRSLPDNPAPESAWVLGDGKESRPLHFEGQIGRWRKDISAYPPGRAKQHSAARCALCRFRQDFR
jgi:hypothetical protein